MGFFQYPGWTRSSLGFLLRGAQHCKINSEIVGSWPAFFGYSPAGASIFGWPTEGKVWFTSPDFKWWFLCARFPVNFLFSIDFLHFKIQRIKKREKKHTHLEDTLFLHLFQWDFARILYPLCWRDLWPKGALASIWRTIRQREPDRWGFDGWRLQRYVKREGNESSLLREKFFEFMWELFFVLKCMLHFGWCFCWLMEIDSDCWEVVFLRLFASQIFIGVWKFFKCGNCVLDPLQTTHRQRSTVGGTRSKGAVQESSAHICSRMLWIIGIAAGT